MPAAAAAEIDPEFIGTAVEPALQSPENGCRNPGRMPVHSHDGAEGLKPERIAESCQEFRSAVAVDYGFDNSGPELRHAVGEPLRHPSAVQREIGYPRAFHQFLW